MTAIKIHDAQTCSRQRMAIQDAIEILSGKWKLPILMTLTFGTYRFKELAREVGITPRMLSKELKELELNLLVSRTVYDTKPVTVEYTLTSHGRTLQPLLTELGKWGTKHRKTVMGR